MSNKGIGWMKYLRIFFGIFMVLVYLGMAALMVVNYFDWSPSISWFRWLLAAVFAIYGVYRGYRQVKGLDYYRLKDNEEPDDDDRVQQLIKKVHDEESKS